MSQVTRMRPPPPPPVEEQKGTVHPEVTEAKVNAQMVKHLNNQTRCSHQGRARLNNSGVMEYLKGVRMSPEVRRNIERSRSVRPLEVEIAALESDTEQYFENPLFLGDKSPAPEFYPNDLAQMLEPRNRVPRSKIGQWEERLKEHMSLQAHIDWSNFGYSEAGRKSDRTGYKKKVAYYEACARQRVVGLLQELGYCEGNSPIKDARGAAARNLLGKLTDRENHPENVFVDKIERWRALTPAPAVEKHQETKTVATPVEPEFDFLAQLKADIAAGFDYKATDRGEVVANKSGDLAREARRRVKGKVSAKALVQILRAPLKADITAGFNYEATDRGEVVKSKPGDLADQARERVLGKVSSSALMQILREQHQANKT